MYAPNKRAYGISVWSLAAVLGPVLGPLVGGFAAQHEGWRWTIWELMWLSGFCFVFLFFFLPETSSANIIYSRTKRLRKLVNKDNYPALKCEPEIEGEGMTGKDIAMMVLVRPFTLTFFEPILLALNLYIALLYALLYIWFESFPIVFIGIYHFNDGELGLAFLGILIGCFIIIGPFWWYLWKYTEPQFKNGELKPELRLPPACVGGFCIPICLFWFGWTSREGVHWIVPIIGTMFSPLVLTSSSTLYSTTSATRTQNMRRPPTLGMICYAPPSVPGSPFSQRQRFESIKASLQS